MAGDHRHGILSYGWTSDRTQEINLIQKEKSTFQPNSWLQPEKWTPRGDYIDGWRAKPRIIIPVCLKISTTMLFFRREKSQLCSVKFLRNQKKGERRKIKAVSSDSVDFFSNERIKYERKIVSSQIEIRGFTHWPIWSLSNYAWIKFQNRKAPSLSLSFSGDGE